MAANRTQQGELFERQVATQFQMLGFSVERDVHLHGRQLDMVLTTRRGPFAIRYLVECKSSAARVTVRELDGFHSRLSSARSKGDPTMRGILVARTGFSNKVREQAPTLGIDLVVAAELGRSLVDLPRIARAQLHELRGDRGVREFVDPSMRLDGRTDAEPALPALVEWSCNTRRNHLTLLGDFGIGKTTLLKRLTVELAERYLAAHAESRPAPAPIYVDLRQYAHVSLRQIVLDLFDRYRLDLASSQAFWQVFEDGQVILLLDGFDELASKSNTEATLQNFREINRTVLGRAKLILSCRSHYFVDDADVREFHGVSDGSLVPAYTALYRDIAGRPNFEIRHLEDFDHDQISALIRARRGDAAEREVWDVLESRYNLADLARRPVLLDMILTSFEQIRRESGEVTSAGLYQVYTDIWMQDNDWNTTLTPDARAKLIEDFAARVTLDTRSELNYAQIPALVREAHPELGHLETQQCDRELRRAGFLIRDGAGNYRFAHKSFREFFVAKHLVRLIRQPAEAPASARRFAPFGWSLSTEVFRFVCDLVRQDRRLVERGVTLLESQHVDEFDRGLLVKFLSRSPAPEVIAALSRIVAADGTRRASSPRSRWEEPISGWSRVYAVTALGWLDRDSPPERFLTLLSDAAEDFSVRHNALLALCRSQHSEAVAAICAFVADCAPLDAVRLFASRIIAAAIQTEERPAVANAIVERWTGDVRFRNAWTEWEFDLQPLCTLCERSTRPEARAVLVEIASRASHVSAVAAAALALDGEELATVEGAVLAAARRQAGPASELALVAALAHVGTAKAAEALVPLLRGKEPVAAAALDALCERWPEHAAAALYGDARLWQGRAGWDRLRLRAAERLHADCPEETVRDLMRLLRKRELALPALDVLKFVREHAPEHLDRATDLVVERDAPLPVLAYAFECRWRDGGAGRAFVIERGLRSAWRSRRIAAVRVLHAETADDVTDALLEALEAERDPETRMHIARALIVPGRALQASRIETLLAEESNPDVSHVLELAQA